MLEPNLTQAGVLSKASIKVSIWMNWRLKKKTRERERHTCPRLWADKKQGRNGGKEINREQKRRGSLEAVRQQKDSFLSDALCRVCICECVRGAAHLCLFVCMNNSGPWRGQPAAVMRRTCIDSKYCWWEAIDPTTICPNFSREAEGFCSLYSAADRQTGGWKDRHDKLIKKGLTEDDEHNLNWPTD